MGEGRGLKVQVKIKYTLIVAIVLLTIRNIDGLAGGPISADRKVTCVGNGRSTSTGAVRRGVGRLRGGSKAKSSSSAEDVGRHFSNTIIVNSSVTTDFARCSMLGASDIITGVKVRFDRLSSRVRRTGRLSPRVIFLTCKVGSMAGAGKSMSGFVGSCSSIVGGVRGTVPSTRVFIGTIFPIRRDTMRGRPTLTGVTSCGRGLRTVYRGGRVKCVSGSSVVRSRCCRRSKVRFGTGFCPV